MCICTFNRYPFSTTPNFLYLWSSFGERNTETYGHFTCAHLDLCTRTSAPFWQDLVSWNPPVIQFTPLRDNINRRISCNWRSWRPKRFRLVINLP